MCANLFHLLNSAAVAVCLINARTTTNEHQAELVRVNLPLFCGCLFEFKRMENLFWEESDC